MPIDEWDAAADWPFLAAGFALTEMRELAEEKDGACLPRVLALAFV